ncbi:MAG TPA: hypothetical protein VHU85_08505 [Acidimicrobiales bacterium]|jgi:hypothetical protein|nr:hypothetical protein [Acidimicrobiales bacterium]
MTRKNRQADASTGDDAVDAGSFEEEEDSYDEEESYDDAEDEVDDEEYDVDEDEEEDESSEEDDGYPDDEEVEVPETPAERRKRVLAARAAGEPVTTEPVRSGPSTKWSIDRLDAREKRFSFVASGAAALFGIFIYVTETQNHNFRLAKGQLTPQTTLIIGLVAAALLAGVTVLGRRAPVGFVALFTGAAFGQTSLFLGVPFFVLAVWLLIRSYRVQKESAAKARAAGGGARARPTAAARSTAARPAAPSRPTTVAEARRARSKKSSAPAGNKRYTPKRLPPPPPKPSRRQRKATASD